MANKNTKTPRTVFQNFIDAAKTERTERITRKHASISRTPDGEPVNTSSGMQEIGKSLPQNVKVFSFSDEDSVTPRHMIENVLALNQTAMPSTRKRSRISEIQAEHFSSQPASSGRRSKRPRQFSGPPSVNVSFGKLIDKATPRTLIQGFLDNAEVSETPAVRGNVNKTPAVPPVPDFATPTFNEQSLFSSSGLSTSLDSRAERRQHQVNPEGKIRIAGVKVRRSSPRLIQSMADSPHSDKLLTASGLTPDRKGQKNLLQTHEGISNLSQRGDTSTGMRKEPNVEHRVGSSLRSRRSRDLSRSRDTLTDTESERQHLGSGSPGGQTRRSTSESGSLHPASLGEIYNPDPRSPVSPLGVDTSRVERLPSSSPGVQDIQKDISRIGRNYEGERDMIEETVPSSSPGIPDSMDGQFAEEELDGSSSDMRHSPVFPPGPKNSSNLEDNEVAGESRKNSRSMQKITSSRQQDTSSLENASIHISRDIDVHGYQEKSVHEQFRKTSHGSKDLFLDMSPHSVQLDRSVTVYHKSQIEHLHGQRNSSKETVSDIDRYPVSVSGIQSPDLRIESDRFKGVVSETNIEDGLEEDNDVDDKNVGNEEKNELSGDVGDSIENIDLDENVGDEEKNEIKKDEGDDEEGSEDGQESEPDMGQDDVQQGEDVEQEEDVGREETEQGIPEGLGPMHFRPGTAKPVSKPVRQRRPRKKDMHTIPTSTVKKLFAHYCQMRVSKDAIEEVMKVSDKFWNSMLDDLDAYAHHAGRKFINSADVELLFRRQGFVTDKQDMNSLIEKYLSYEEREQLIPMAMAGNKVV